MRHTFAIKHNFANANDFLNLKKMKKAKLLIGLSALLAWGGLHAQPEEGNAWHIGVGGAFRTTGMHFSDIDESVFPTGKNLNGGVFNIFAEYAFGKGQHFAVRPGLSFLKRGGKLTEIGSPYEGDIDDVSYRLKSKYMDIRVPVMYQFLDEKSVWRPYVFLAPVFGLSLGGEIETRAEYTTGDYEGYVLDLNKANMSGIYFAGMVGAGVKFRPVIGGHRYFVDLGLAYEYGFTNTYGKKEKDGTAIIESGLFTNVYKVDGKRKFSGFELSLSVGVPISVFKKKPEPAPEPAPKPEPVVVKKEERPVVKVEEKPCYTLEEINDLMLRGEDVKGKTICAIGAITFDFGKSTIKKESNEYLNQLAKTLIRTNAKIEVKGHTDNVGSEEFNLNLSKERAKAVVQYLINRGVPERNLSYSYYGMSKPLTANDTEDGRTMNRRVEFEILK